MSEPAHENDSLPDDLAVDLTGIPLDQIARLCESAAGELSPDEASDRPILRRALRRALETAGHGGEVVAGHGQVPPPPPPPST